MLRLLCLGAVLVSVSAVDTARYFLFRSEDHGRSWIRSGSGLPGDSRINALAETTGTVIAATDSGIFVSRDAGRNWQPSNITGTNAIRVVATAGINDQLFAAAHEIILTSNDGGRNWLTNQTFPRHLVRSLFPYRNALYAGTDADGVYRSSDLGRSWIHLSEGLPKNAQVLSFAAFQNEIFSGLYSNGLFKLRLPEENWIRVGAAEGIRPLVLASTRQSLIAGHNPGGIHWSRDAGRTWKLWAGERGSTDSPTPAAQGFEFALGQAEVSLDAPIWELGAENQIVFAGAADGILYSEDHGQSWTRATVGLPKVSPGIAFLVRSNFVLAATLSNYKSYLVNEAK